MSKRDYAKRTLTHYITLTMREAGMKVDGDTYAELSDCVDTIIDAAVEEAKAALLAEAKGGAQ